MTNTNRPAEIAAAREADTKIGAAWDLYWAAQDPITALLAEARKADKMTRYYGSESPSGKRSAERAARLRADAETKAPAALALAQAARDLDAKLYKGWTRFFLVKHIHSSQSCSSFRPTTKIGWLPDVSGLTEAEAVALHGATLCTICFPSAPVELTTPAADPSVCVGSGKGIGDATNVRRGYAAGNWAECPDCGKRVGISNSAFRIPKHKPEAK